MLLIKSGAWSSFKYLKRISELKKQYRHYTEQYCHKDYLTQIQKAKMCYLPTRMWGTHTSPCRKPLACQLGDGEWLMWEEEHQTWEEYRSRAYLTESLNTLKFVKVKYFILDKLISMKIIKHKFKLWIGSV